VCERERKKEKWMFLDLIRPKRERKEKTLKLDFLGS